MQERRNVGTWTHLSLPWPDERESKKEKTSEGQKKKKCRKLNALLDSKKRNVAGPIQRKRRVKPCCA